MSVMTRCGFGLLLMATMVQAVEPIAEIHGCSSVTLGVVPLQSPQVILFRGDSYPRTKDILSQHLEALDADPDSWQLQLEVGLDFFSLASSERWEYLDRACEQFRKVLKTFPEDPFLIMYLGRAIGARALNVNPSIYSRLKWAKEGFKLMDRAVALNPDCQYLRLLRGDAQLMAHPVLRRGGRLKEDAAIIMDAMSKDTFGEVADYYKARFHLFAAQYLAKKGTKGKPVEDHLHAAMVVGRNTPLGREAEAKLTGSWVDLGYQEN